MKNSRTKFSNSSWIKTKHSFIFDRIYHHWLRAGKKRKVTKELVTSLLNLLRQSKNCVSQSLKSCGKKEPHLHQRPHAV
jgi:hypothetical protein